MVKQVNWQSKLQQVDEEIDLLQRLIATKEQEKTYLEEIVSGGGLTSAFPASNPSTENVSRDLAEHVVEELNKGLSKRRGRPPGSKNKVKAENVSKILEENDGELTKRRGRPPGSKNKQKQSSVVVDRVIINRIQEESSDLEELLDRLENIGQTQKRPIKLDDFVKILNREGFDYKSKIVRAGLNNLVAVGKFIQNDDEDRSYEYFTADSDYGF